MKDPELSAAIKSYEAALHPLAMRLQGRDGAEYEDLIQEGRISVWQALQNGVVPSMVVAFKRMLMWIRTLRPQNPAPYEEIEHGGE